MKNDGKIIVIEGSVDGVGKTKQTELLYKRLTDEGYNISTHHFPTYGTYHGVCVEKYLNGDLGDKEKLSPYFINSLFAIDRAIVWQTKLKKLYEEGNILLLDRYTTSSLIFQSAYIEDSKEKTEFIKYIEDFEYNKLGTRRPDSVIFLTAPFELVTDLRKKRKINDGILNDIHEVDEEFQRKVYESANFIADYLSWDKIDCSNGNQFRTIEDIHEEVYKLVKTKIK